MTELRVERLFDSKGSLAEQLMETAEYPWQLIPKIGEFIRDLVTRLSRDPEWYMPREGVCVHRRAEIADSAVITGPAVIAGRAELRPGAYLRGNVLVCGGCVVGNSTELKNAVLLEGAKLPHFNYGGDSVFGRGSHMGAGAVASNLRLDGKNIFIKKFDTGLRKFGAAVGDGAEIGCHCVLNPGTVLGRNSRVYPGVCIKGTVEENCTVSCGNLKNKS